MKRRTFVGAVAASLPAFSILTAGGVRAQSKEIRMIEAGGLSGDSIQVGYIDPLKAKTGITVVRESPSSLGKLRAWSRAARPAPRCSSWARASCCRPRNSA